MRQVREQVALFTPANPQGIQLWANNTTQELTKLAQEFGYRLNRVAPLDGSENFTGEVTFEAGIKLLDNQAVTFGDGDDVTLSFDGTDFNIDGTVDLNLTSFTAINAGTVDADFDALTATSYGGITEANLLDKSAVETISGAYTFTGGVTFTTGNIVAGTVDADFGAVTATSYGGVSEANLLDKSAAETITGAWDFTTGGLTVDSNHVLQGYATGKNIVRSVRVRVEPGATPGTNINVSVISGRGFNEGSYTDAADLAKSDTDGDFSLNAGGDVISFAGETVVGVIGIVATVHDINSSSTTEMYVFDGRSGSNAVAMRVFQRGSQSTTDWTTIMDAGDRVELQVVYISSD